MTNLLKGRNSLFLVVAALAIWIAVLYVTRVPNNNTDSLEQLRQENALLKKQSDSLVKSISEKQMMIDRLTEEIDIEKQQRDAVASRLYKVRNDYEQLKRVINWTDHESELYYRDVVLPGLMERFDTLIQN